MNNSISHIKQAESRNLQCLVHLHVLSDPRGNIRIALLPSAGDAQEGAEGLRLCPTEDP